MELYLQLQELFSCMTEPRLQRDFTLGFFHGLHLEAVFPIMYTYYMLFRSSPSHNTLKCLKMGHCYTPTISLFIIH